MTILGHVLWLCRLHCIRRETQKPNLLLFMSLTLLLIDYIFSLFFLLISFTPAVALFLKINKIIMGDADLLILSFDLFPSETNVLIMLEVLL